MLIGVAVAILLHGLQVGVSAFVKAPPKARERSVPPIFLMFLESLLVFAVVCCVCCGCMICSCCLARHAAVRVMQAVKNLRVRRPCTLGLACDLRDEKHLSTLSHPDDDDYGFAVRVYGGKPQFCTLRQCFNFMDPYQRGYVIEKAALRELLQVRNWTFSYAVSEALKHWSFLDVCKALRHGSLRDQIVHDIWDSIDTDGNGYLSFPEFVEWASGPGQSFGFPKHVGVVGSKGKAGLYAFACTLDGCSCTNFQFGKKADERFCTAHGCGHRRGYHAASPNDQILAVLPLTWSLHPGAAVHSGTPETNYDSDWVVKTLTSGSTLRKCGSDIVGQIQLLLDASVKKTWTRDRGNNKVPSGYDVVRVDRNENIRVWLKYVLRKALVMEAIGGGPPIKQYEMRTSHLAQTLPLMELERPDEKINEWYLWHGASSEGARGIAKTEFKQNLAGSTTGTLYGRGTYLSDSCTKADEYAKAASDGEDAGLFCLLLCRVMGGRVRYTDEVKPDAALLEHDVLEGNYDCVLGDREACRNTFKEIVIYESTQAYPEYLVYYRRKFSDMGQSPSWQSPVTKSVSSSEP